MAGEMRTIQVRGLPVGGSETRLVDKLQIHFLRKKNGGGEISSVTVSKTTPGTAFITFEESEVASRLAQKGEQVFKINDRSYGITISLHHGEVDVDKVLLGMSVSVDHTRLPDGKSTLLCLHKRFPDVHLVFDDQNHLCTVKGRYSDVQTLSSLVLDSLESQDQSPADNPQPKAERKKTYKSPPEDLPNKRFGANEEIEVLKPSTVSPDLDLDLEYEKNWETVTGLPLPGSYSDQASGAALTDNTWNSFEDFSLIVDSDIFHYLHKFCSVEYQSILSRHSIEVLDVSCDDITTLYLKPKTARSGHNLGSVKKAHQDLAKLYQHQESLLRKEHVYKPEVPEKDLAHALELLRVKMPRLMIDVEDRNVYMVGSKREVSEAKQIIGDLHGFGMGKEINMDHVFASSQLKKQGSSAASDPPGVLPSTHQESHDLFMPNKDTKQIRTFGELSSKRTHNSEDTDVIAQSGQFTKNSAEDLFSILRKPKVPQEIHGLRDTECMELERNKYTDFYFQPSCPSTPLDFPSWRTDLQSLSNVKGSETSNKMSKAHKNKQTEPVKERKIAANFGVQDLTSYKLHEGAFEKVAPDGGQPHSLPIIKPPMTSSLEPNTLRATMGTKNSARKLELEHDKKPTLNPAGLSGDQGARSSSTISTTSGSALRRSNSCSGRMQKLENKLQAVEDLTSGQSPDTQTREISAMDLVVPFKLWLYLTSVYNTEIENMTSDLQVKEKLGEDGLTLCLKGVNSEKVCECHRSLKRLVATTETDFVARNVPLSELGVSDYKDKTLLELCSLMKQHFKMVKVLAMSRDVMILGPKRLCDEVEATMIKTFRKDGNTATSMPAHGPEGLHTLLSSHSTKPDTDLIKKDLPETSDQDKTHVSIKVPQIYTQEEADGTQMKMKEELDKKDDGTMNKKNGETLFGTTSQSNNDQMNPGVSVTQSSTQDLKSDIPSSQASGIQILALCYVCEKVLKVKQAACGFNFCPECDKKVHSTCKTCAPTGIKGSMSFQESTITLPGFNRDTTLKIVYDIPDGIQAEDHPCPGAPFRGNRFEAFLPFNKTTKKLVPLLEKAFHQGLTFTVKEEGGEGKVIWGSIPHKTRTEGGTSKNGYPDSTYIRRLDDALKAAGVGE